MTRSELLALMRLLSALESWSFSVGKVMPDYLHEDLCRLVTRLEEEILGEATKEPGNG